MLSSLIIKPVKHLARLIIHDVKISQVRITKFLRVIIDGNITWINNVQYIINKKTKSVATICKAKLMSKKYIIRFFTLTSFIYLGLCTAIFCKQTYKHPNQNNSIYKSHTDIQAFYLYLVKHRIGIMMFKIKSVVFPIVTALFSKQI